MRSHALLSTLFVTLAASCFAQTPSEDALPDAPQPQPSVVATSPTPPPVTRPTAGFFTFRKSYLDPPLRTNKQVLTSKLFLIMHGMLLASLAVDKWRLPDARALGRGSPGGCRDYRAGLSHGSILYPGVYGGTPDLWDSALRSRRCAEGFEIGVERRARSSSTGPWLWDAKPTHRVKMKIAHYLMRKSPVLGPRAQLGSAQRILLF
jgi:hypothetical protein